MWIVTRHINACENSAADIGIVRGSQTARTCVKYASVANCGRRRADQSRWAIVQTENKRLFNVEQINVYLTRYIAVFKYVILLYSHSRYNLKTRALQRLQAVAAYAEVVPS